MKTQTVSALRGATFVVLALITAAAFLFSFGKLHPTSVHAHNNLGAPLPGLTTGQLNAFNLGGMQFNVQWDPVKGLGPVFTNQNCSICHAQPFDGGTNTTMRTNFFGALNIDGSFNPLTSEGGFVQQPLTASIFIPGCPVQGEFVPTDATIQSQRVPPDLFGFGLVDNIPDKVIEAFATNKGMGIQGSANMVADWNGTLRPGRFGTKAQFASLVQAAGTAFLHDIGVTNPVVINEDCPNASPGTPACPLNLVPQICIRDREPNDLNGKETIQIFDYLVYLAPLATGTGNSNGQALFTSLGCALCHNPQYTTKANVKVPVNFTGGLSPIVTALSTQPVNLYSDLLIHHLGPGLADCMQFGQANGDQWRTTPLWGLGNRTVYLHDGRTTDLLQAIEDHLSFAGTAKSCPNTYPDSEANQVITNFNALSPSDQADVMTFIQSL